MILRRLEDSRFSEVMPSWEGETAVVIACGGSLTREQVEAVRESSPRAIAVNDAFLWADFADAHYAADSHWHAWMTEPRYDIAKPLLGLSAEEVRRRWAEFSGQKCTIENSGANVRDERVHMLRNQVERGHSYGLSLDARYLVTGRNSGFQALNLAVLAGAKQILLLGFDGERGEKEHFHGGHLRPTPIAVYPLYRQAMEEAKEPLRKAGVTVLNCTPGTAIRTFPRVRLDVALCEFA